MLHRYLAHHGVAAADVRLSRRVQLGVFVPQKCWSTLNITTSNMVGWSFSSVLPELTCEDGSALASTAFDAATHHQHCSYMARHAGNTDAFDFWLEFTQPAPVTITLATVCVPAHGPPSPAVELFEQVRRSKQAAWWLQRVTPLPTRRRADTMCAMVGGTG